ncbi:MAG: imidazole glycerol phosphate synthase subunit HisH [Kaiparowitsia implicata GSE-PSE-MK54-09C]|jgi:glutamine amidotransferase|nr:imidazole glycerol phosphate synthase subunit HisH [Kaiparowitsia implicata GSE-PSE-MK54-09C]
MIRIVKYGLGNIAAFANIYRRLNIECATAETAEELATASKIILPGVGAFDWAMQLLAESGMRECLDDMVLNRNVPVLGVCVGMQMMANSSEEGQLPGLGWIDADVRRFDEARFTTRTHLPHMGWSTVQPKETTSLFNDMPDPQFYFLHSYLVAPLRHENVLAETDYGSPFASAVSSDNIFGVQFHPEKSHQWGIKLLQNFAEL